MAVAIRRQMLAMAIAASMAKVNDFAGYRAGALDVNPLSINRVLGTGGRSRQSRWSPRPNPRPFLGARQWKARKRQNHGNGVGRSN